MSIFGIPLNTLTIAAFLILTVNVVTFAFYGADKLKARKKKWRIPESTLLWLAFMGGALGALLGMLTFRHKTRHRKFVTLVPLFLILQMALSVCFLL